MFGSIQSLETQGKTEEADTVREIFERVHHHLEDEYMGAGEVEFGGPWPPRVLVRADLERMRRYDPLDLPCFTRAEGQPAAGRADSTQTVTAR